MSILLSDNFGFCAQKANNLTRIFSADNDTAEIDTTESENDTSDIDNETGEIATTEADIDNETVEVCQKNSLSMSHSVLFNDNHHRKFLQILQKFFKTEEPLAF